MPPASTDSSYWALSRAPRYSLTFALPLLLAYEALAALLGDAGGGGLRNGADVWLKTPFVALLGPHGPLAFGLLMGGLALALVVRDLRRTRQPLRGEVFAGMLAESAVMAVVCGLVVGTATARLVHALPTMLIAAQPITSLGLPSKLMIALGAGLYEELLFRVVLVSGLMLLARRAIGLGPAASALLATVGGAILFALAHHVGAYGEALTLPAFTFRMLAGLFFSGLYVLRGFGITAWTHALYDVMVLVIR
ncbi:MAG: CPBP family intramembrane glutamic endopeptidase [Gemmatirosa sp.]